MIRARIRSPLSGALIGCALVFALLAACGGSGAGGEQTATGGMDAGSGSESSGGSGTVSEAPTAGSNSDGGSDFSTLSSRGMPAADGGASASQAAGLHFELPAGWQQQPPSSSMRLAQAAIPGPGGPGELTVFFFGAGGGGGREANIERWVGQMEVEDQPQRESFESNGLQITWVDVSGTMKPSTMGMGPTEPQPGYRLYGAVVEGPGGPWFFKATGPEETLAAAREDFLALLQSLRPAG